MPVDRFASTDDLLKSLGGVRKPAEPPRLQAARNMIAQASDAEREETFLSLLDLAETEAEIDSFVQVGAELGLVDTNEAGPVEPAPETAEEEEEPSEAEERYNAAVEEGLSHESAAEYAYQEGES